MDTHTKSICSWGRINRANPTPLGHSSCMCVFLEGRWVCPSLAMVDIALVFDVITVCTCYAVGIAFVHVVTTPKIRVEFIEKLNQTVTVMRFNDDRAPKYVTDWPMWPVTVDVAVFRPPNDDDDDDDTKILLIRRGRYPYENHLALPGGFMDLLSEETDEMAAARELREETGVTVNPGKMMRVTSRANHTRDPRGPTCTIVFAIVVPKDTQIRAGDDARDAKWQSISRIEEKDLAFDHKELLDGCKEAVKGLVSIPGM